MLRVGTPYEFNVALDAASSAPTSWTADNLPSGLSINSSGKISGTPTVAGVREVTIRATNDVPETSDPVIIAFAVNDKPYVGDGALPLDFDFGSGVVTNPYVTNGAAPLFVKFGDTKPISLGLKLNGSLIEKNAAAVAVRLIMDEDDPSSVVNIARGELAQIGAADNTRYNVLLEISGDTLADKMADWEKKFSEGGEVWGEIEVTVLEPPPGGGDAELMPITSASFKVQLQQQIG